MTKTEHRGSILKNRLDILNEYLIDEAGTGKPFDRYLFERKITKGQFIAHLPKNMNAPPVNYDDVFRYAEKMNGMHYALFLEHKKHKEIADIKKQAVALNSTDCFGADCDDGYHNLSGKLKDKIKKKHEERKENREENKEERKEKHEERKENREENKAERKEKHEDRKDARKERIDELKKKLKEAGYKVGDTLGHGKAVHAVNKFNPAFVIVRGSVLAMLNENMVGISSALSHVKSDNEHWEKLQQKWWMIGGEKDAWDKAIDKGKNKKKLFKNLFDKHKKHSADGVVDGNYNAADGDGEEKSPADAIITASAGIATLAGVLAVQPEPVLSKTTAAVVASGAGVFGSMGGILKSFAKKNGAVDVNDVPETPDLPDAPAPTDDKTLDKVANEMDKTDENGNKVDANGNPIGFFKKNMGIIIGSVLAAAALIGIAFAMSGKKK